MKGYLRRTSDMHNGTILVLPWAMIYVAGVLWTGLRFRSGVDLLTSALARTGGVWAVVGANLLLAAGAILLWRRARPRRKELRPTDLAAILAETALWAALVAFGLLWLLAQIPGTGAGSGPGMAIAAPSTVGAFVIASGAGLYEELLFRLLLVSGIIALLHGRFGPAPLTHAVVAVLIAALIFSLCHQLAGEPFQRYAFLYRVGAGVIFGAIFLLRGFAAAVYTHILYDLWVFLR